MVKAKTHEVRHALASLDFRVLKPLLQIKEILAAALGV